MSNFFSNERVALSKRGKKTFAHLGGLVGTVECERRSPLWGHCVIVRFTVGERWERIYAKPNELVSKEAHR